METNELQKIIKQVSFGQKIHLKTNSPEGYHVEKSYFFAFILEVDQEKQSILIVPEYDFKIYYDQTLPKRLLLSLVHSSKKKLGEPEKLVLGQGVNAVKKQVEENRPTPKWFPSTWVEDLEAGPKTSAEMLEALESDYQLEAQRFELLKSRGG